MNKYCMCGQEIYLETSWNGDHYIDVPSESHCPRCGEWTGGKLLNDAPRADELAASVAQLAEEVNTLSARVRELEAALEPFAAAADELDAHHNSYLDGDPILAMGWPSHKLYFFVRQFRAARRALRGQGPAQGQEGGE